jgi:hypothetical protein
MLLLLLSYQYGEIFLPPQIFLHMRTHGGEHVIKVHNYVHKCVDKAKEAAVTASRKFDTPPGSEIN